MTFREHLLKLDPNLIIEGSEELDYDVLFIEIKNILEQMSDDEIDEFGAFLAVEFFDVGLDEVDDTYYDYDNVIELINELGEESYGFILDLILPEDFPDGTDAEYNEFDDLDGLDEAVSRRMGIKKLNKKKRKFFTKSAATLRKERSGRLKKNRLNRATNRSYKRVNKEKIKAYQKSRATFMSKGRHFTKIRRKSGE